MPSTESNTRNAALITDLYRSQFDDLERNPQSNGSTAAAHARKEAFARFRDRGLPTPREEDWRYTDVARLGKIAFSKPERIVPALEEVESLRLVSPEETRLVFVDGYFSRELSSVEGLPRGVVAGSTADALSDERSSLRATLGGELGTLRTQPFVDLNSAVFEDGLYIRVPPGVAIERPIHALFLTTDQAEPTANHPRSLIVIERDGSATLIEEYASFGGAPRFTNPVLECRLAENAALEHYRIVRESDATFHISAVGARIERHARLRSFSFVFGGGLVRNDVEVELAGENGECTLNGLAVVAGERHVDNHTRLVHAQPHCRSWEVYKTILADHATGVFNGQIFVDPIAQKTDAKQTNQSVLLSPLATMNSKPELEIYADDVRCTHGATVGQLDEEAMFYLKSRGLGPEEARNLLIFAFASEIVSDVRVPALEERLSRELFVRLPGTAGDEDPHAMRKE